MTNQNPQNLTQLIQKLWFAPQSSSFVIVPFSRRHFVSLVGKSAHFLAHLRTFILCPFLASRNLEPKHNGERYFHTNLHQNVDSYKKFLIFVDIL